ncbi:MAG: hypothetical protein KAU21_01060, partial [Gammaproteobacteria bacterium]|nr:hypothetical protein [Gammaproteobacteria bacterium]
MSNNIQPDEMLDFNMDEFLGDDSHEVSSDSTNTSSDNCSTTADTAPGLVSPGAPLSIAPVNTKINKAIRLAGKTKSQNVSGNLVVISADGQEATVDALHKTMQVGDAFPIHCISDAHTDRNPSSVVRKHESGDIHFYCSSCGFNEF